MPAPPKITTRCSSRPRLWRPRIPARIAATVIAPVPWMSSLKIRTSSRLRLRIRRAFEAPKSSKVEKRVRASTDRAGASD